MPRPTIFAVPFESIMPPSFAPVRPQIAAALVLTVGAVGRRRRRKHQRMEKSAYIRISSRGAQGVYVEVIGGSGSSPPKLNRYRLAPKSQVPCTVVVPPDRAAVTEMSVSLGSVETPTARLPVKCEASDAENVILSEDSVGGAIKLKVFSALPDRPANVFQLHRHGARVDDGVIDPDESAHDAVVKQRLLISLPVAFIYRRGLQRFRR